MSRELEVLREEYWRVRENPIFDNPSDYCILLDLITDRIEELEGGEDDVETVSWSSSNPTGEVNRGE